MTPDQLRRIHALWAEAYGFDPAALDRPGFTLVPSAGLASPPRLVVFRTNTHALVFTPPSFAEQLATRLPTGAVVTAADVQAALGDVPTQRGSTDFILYFDPERGVPSASAHVRPLREEDAAALDTLNAVLSERDRELGNVAASHDVVLGWFDEEGRLLGAASLIVEEEVADVGVLTHRDARGRGVGLDLVRALAHEGARRGWLVQYTTLESNVASVRIAEKTGFVRFAVEEAVRVEAS